MPAFQVTLCFAWTDSSASASKVVVRTASSAKKLSPKSDVIVTSALTDLPSVFGGFKKRMYLILTLLVFFVRWCRSHGTVRALGTKYGMVPSLGPQPTLQLVMITVRSDNNSYKLSQQQRITFRCRRTLRAGTNLRDRFSPSCSVALMIPGSAVRSTISHKTSRLPTNQHNKGSSPSARTM